LLHGETDVFDRGHSAETFANFIEMQKGH
jgi:hypothetical protein